MEVGIIFLGVYYWVYCFSFFDPSFEFERDNIFIAFSATLP